MIRLCLSIALAFSLSACATLERPQWLENYAACSLDLRTPLVVSDWGLFAFSLKLRKGDAPYICRSQAPSPSASKPVDVVLP